MSGIARILLLADEPSDMAALKGLLAETAGERGVHYATSTADALAALEKNDFEVVFCDLSTGPEVAAQFLQEVWKQRPRTVRYLVARGLTPDLMVTCALGSHHFLQKPLDALTLGAALSRADAISQFVRNDRIQSLVSRMRTLPSRPSLYLEVMRELRSSTASATTVGEIVEKDLAISTKLIQVVNSAFYGVSQEVTEPAAAVLLLGLETTASLVLSIEAFARFDKVKPIYFSMDRVWRHSQSVALSAKRIAELLCNDPDVARNAFTAGLLHDIGKLALALNFEEQYQGAIKLADKQKIAPCEVEAQVFGATHAETGAYLLSVWGLPLPIVEAVARNHNPARSMDKHFSATTALHLAERLEYAEESARTGKDVVVDLDYPASLQLAGRMEELKALVRRTAAGDSPKAEKGEATAGREPLRADPAALPASGEPAPLLEISSETPKGASRKAVILVVASLAMLFAVTFFVKAQGSKAKAGGENTELAEAAGRDGISNQSSESAKPAAEDALAGLKLQAVTFNGTKSSMVINGRTLHVGDEIGGAKIVGVEANEVILEKAGLKHTLRMH